MATAPAPTVEGLQYMVITENMWIFSLADVRDIFSETVYNHRLITVESYTET